MGAGLLDGCRDLLLDDCAPLACDERPVRFVGGYLLTTDTDPEIAGYSAPLLSTTEPEPSFVDAYCSLLVLFFLKGGRRISCLLKLGKGPSTVQYCTLLQHAWYLISPFLDTIQKDQEDTEILGSMFQVIDFFLELAGLRRLHVWKC